MTDGDAARGASPDGRGGTRPDRRSVLLGGGVAAVLLAVVGAAGGWMIAGRNDRAATPAAEAPARETPAASPPRRPAPTTSRTTAAPVRPTGPTVPNLVGTDFEEARDELRKRGLGWRLVFGTGRGASVVSTEPAAGAPARRGMTVRLVVAGPAPESSVPDVVGEECAEAAEELVDDGFRPRHRTKKRGMVSRQEPAADTVGRWNDPVAVWCGTSDGAAEPTAGGSTHG